MKRFLKYGILMLGAAMVLTGCTGPKTIPDNKLELIFEDIFLTNSYYNTVGNAQQADTLDIYRPILKKYGYKTRDLTYTIENYSKRKSVRIADVVERSIRRLEKEERYYAGLVVRQDSLEDRAARLYSTTVYYDSAIRVFSLADTAKLKIEIPVSAGSYDVKMWYVIDSLDRNGRSSAYFEMLGKTGNVTNSVHRGLSTRVRNNFHIEIPAASADHALRIRLAGYGPRMKAPHVTIDSIRIVYKLPTHVALDSLFVHDRNLIYTFPQYVDRLDPDTPDNGPLRADPPGLPEGGDDNL